VTPALDPGSDVNACGTTGGIRSAPRAHCGHEEARAARHMLRYRVAWHNAAMGGDITPEVSALAINVTIPEALRWTDTRRGEVFMLTTLNIRLLPDGHLAAKAYGRPTCGGRGTYVAFPVPNSANLTALIAEAAGRAGALWAAHRGLG
jgi:hypothetical protein